MRLIRCAARGFEGSERVARDGNGRALHFVITSAQRTPSGSSAHGRHGVVGEGRARLPKRAVGPLHPKRQAKRELRGDAERHAERARLHDAAHEVEPLREEGRRPRHAHARLLGGQVAGVSLRRHCRQWVLMERRVCRRWGTQSGWRNLGIVGSRPRWCKFMKTRLSFYDSRGQPVTIRVDAIIVEGLWANLLSLRGTAPKATEK